MLAAKHVWAYVTSQLVIYLCYSAFPVCATHGCKQGSLKGQVKYGDRCHGNVRSWCNAVTHLVRCKSKTTMLTVSSASSASASTAACSLQECTASAAQARQYLRAIRNQRCKPCIGTRTHAQVRLRSVTCYADSLQLC